MYIFEMKFKDIQVVVSHFKLRNPTNSDKVESEWTGLKLVKLDDRTIITTIEDRQTSILFPLLGPRR